MARATIAYFASTYLHQDFREEFGSAGEALSDFLREETEDCTGLLRADVEHLLEFSPGEEALRESWIGAGGHNYDPTDEGMTYRQWFARMRQILS